MTPTFTMPHTIHDEEVLRMVPLLITGLNVRSGILNLVV